MTSPVATDRGDPGDAACAPAAPGARPSRHSWRSRWRRSSARRPRHPVVADAGGFVRWGVLYARVVHDLAASATIGLLIHAAYLVPETTRTNRRVTATRLAGIAAGLWALAGGGGCACWGWPT